MTPNNILQNLEAVERAIRERNDAAEDVMQDIEKVLIDTKVELLSALIDMKIEEELNRLKQIEAELSTLVNAAKRF